MRYYTHARAHAHNQDQAMQQSGLCLVWDRAFLGIMLHVGSCLTVDRIPCGGVDRVSTWDRVLQWVVSHVSSCLLWILSHLRSGLVWVSRGIMPYSGPCHTWIVPNQQPCLMWESCLTGNRATRGKLLLRKGTILHVINNRELHDSRWVC